MKLRWILRVALAHFVITSGAVFFVLPWLPCPDWSSPDLERHLRAMEVANAAFMFPVGLLQWALPVIPMVLNSLLWGYAIVWLFLRMRRRAPPPAVAAPAGGTTARVRSFPLETLGLALLSLAFTPVASSSALAIFTLLLLMLVAIRSVTRRLARRKGWTLLKTTVWRYACVSAFLLAFLLLTIIPWPDAAAGGPPRSGPASCAESVARLRRMQDRWIPPHLMMRGGIRWRTDFDVNRYFTVLTRLAPQPGWTLDYVYAYNELGGHPVLYARRQWTMPLLSYEAYCDATPEVGSEEQPPFLLHVRTDGTPEGFVQLGLLHIMANQFYLYWHACYNDQRVVLDHADLDALLAKKSVHRKTTDETAEERQKITTLDLQPVAEFKDGKVEVSLFTWTDWGGLRRKRFTFTREFPHRLVKLEKEEIVSYSCGGFF